MENLSQYEKNLKTGMKIDIMMTNLISFQPAGIPCLVYLA